MLNMPYMFEEYIFTHMRAEHIANLEQIMYTLFIANSPVPADRRVPCSLGRHRVGHRGRPLSVIRIPAIRSYEK